MIQRIGVLALMTCKESIRDRILLTLGVFSLLLLGSTLFLGSISLDQDAKMMIDFGLTGIFGFGVIIALFVGGSTITKELDQHTAYTVLARPLKRSWFIVSKFVGMALTLGVLTGAMALLFFALLAIRLNIHAVDASLLLAVLYIYLELLVLLSLMVCFSSVTSSIMSLVYGFAVFLIGHATPTIVSLITSTKSSARYLFMAIYYIFPNLEKFNLRNDAVYHLHPQSGEVSLVIAYAALLCSIFLFLASIALQKQDL